VVIGALVCLFSIGASYAQQVEVPREKAGGTMQHTKPVTAQPIVEVRPQTVAGSQALNLSAPKLSVEQMRQAGALAAQKVKEENHDIETDSSDSDLPAPQTKKQTTASAVRAVDRSEEHTSELQSLAYLVCR